MPWTAEEFKSKHNKKLSPAKAAHAAKVANAVLKQTGDDAKAIRIANAAGRRLRKGKK